ncbi:hypothetical protein [Photobacterium sp. DNB22_13_2]
MIRRTSILLFSLILLPFNAIADALDTNRPDDLISLSAELMRDTVFPETEATYLLTVESRADVHFSRVNPPRAEGVSVRRGSQDHEYYFIDNEEFRISTYRFHVAAEKLGSIILDGASLTHVAINENGTRRRARNKADTVTLESRPKPDSYQGLWLPSEKVTLDQYWSTEASAVQVGDSITRTLSLLIQGRNIDSFPQLMVDYPDSMHVYSEEPKFKDVDDGMKMTLRQVIVPRKEGMFEIQGISIPWFDTDNGEIMLASVDGLALNILPNQTQTLALEGLDKNEPSNDHWRYATMIVCVLWLLTLNRLYKAHKKLNGARKATGSIVRADNCLQAALEQRNHQAVVRAWGSADLDVKKACSQLMDAYFATFYSATPTDGEPERMAVLAYLKERRLEVKIKSDFAQLEP